MPCALPVRRYKNHKPKNVGGRSIVGTGEPNWPKGYPVGHDGQCIKWGSYLEGEPITVWERVRHQPACGDQLYCASLVFIFFFTLHSYKFF